MSVVISYICNNCLCFVTLDYENDDRCCPYCGGRCLDAI